MSIWLSLYQLANRFHRMRTVIREFAHWALLRCRWDVEDYFDPDPDAEGKMYIREGGFIENAEFFDASFFRISLAEVGGSLPAAFYPEQHFSVPGFTTVPARWM